MHTGLLTHSYRGQIDDIEGKVISRPSPGYAPLLGAQGSEQAVDIKFVKREFFNDKVRPKIKRSLSIIIIKSAI